MIANTDRVSFVAKVGKIAVTTSAKVGHHRIKISVVSVGKQRVVLHITVAATRSEISASRRA
jgi:hypothetical protein